MQTWHTLMTYLDTICRGSLILVNELIPAEIIPLVWFAGISITVYFFFRRFSDVIKEKIKHTSRTRKTVDTEDTANQKKQLLELGTSIPPEVINIAFKPIVKKLIGFVGKI